MADLAVKKLGGIDILVNNAAIGIERKGRIINITSESFFTGSHGFAHYVNSKGGIIGLTRALARELGDYGIHINVVDLGVLANETGLALIRGGKSKYDVNLNCIKRVGTPEDVVGAVSFLASDESDFITGQTIVVNGGRLMH